MATPRALRGAVKRGDAKKVAALVAAGADVHDVDPAGRSGLVWAATQGKEPVVAVLLDSGARVDVVDDEGWSPLMYASYRGHAGVVKQLLEARADPMPCAFGGDWEGKSALDIAGGRGHAECAALISAASSNRSEHVGLLEPVPEPEQLHVEPQPRLDGEQHVGQLEPEPEPEQLRVEPQPQLDAEPVAAQDGLLWKGSVGLQATARIGNKLKWKPGYGFVFGFAVAAAAGAGVSRCPRLELYVGKTPDVRAGPAKIWALWTPRAGEVKATVSSPGRKKSVRIFVI